MLKSRRPQGGSLFYKPAPRKQEVRKKRWNAGRIAWTAVKRTCMVIGAAVLISALITVVSLTTLVQKKAPALPKDMVLVLRLDEGFSEKVEHSSFSDLLPAQRPTIRQVTDTLDAAKDDDRVKALIVNLKGGGFTLAHIEEFRAAVKRFQTSGKKAYLYSSSFADTGSGMGAYYLASAFDEIWMQPVGMLSVSGFSAEVPYGREVLDKIGVRAQFLQREEYKSAMESFTNKAMSKESRKTWETILGGYTKMVVGDISAERGIAEDKLMAMVNKGLMSGTEAVDAGLLTRLDYADVLVSDLRRAFKGDPNDKSLEFVPFIRYGNAQDGAKSLNHSYGPRVALIYITGAITPTRASQDGAAADEIAPAINEAAEDNGIDIIIVRIDSPGGSPSASETIRRAIVRAKEKGKTVIVSMGNVAASGGYWIAADADYIFANRSTLTGSIGVLMGKFEASALWDKVGVNWDSVDAGTNADLWSMNTPFSDAQMARLNMLIDETYDAFLTRVAQGRKMDKTQVRAIAKGQVWTGSLALERNLVDKTGTLYDALGFAAELLGQKTAQDLFIEVLPRPKSPVEQLIELFEQQGGAVSAIEMLGQWMPVFAPFLHQMQAAQDPQAYMTYNADLDMAVSATGR